MEYDYVFMGLIASLVANAYLFFLVRTMHSRERFVLETSREMIALSETFSHELQQLKDATEEIE